MYRVLIADDQVPDNSLSSEEDVKTHYLNQYDQEFAKGFVFLYKLAKLLKSRGYEVDCANNPAKLRRLIEKENYNAVVLDLGWWTIKDKAYDEKMILGWKLGEYVKDHSPAPILMFSNRFYEDDELAKTTAEMGYLPVYKSYDEASMKNLLVAIKYATFGKSPTDLLNEKQKLHAFHMYRRLSTVLLGTITSAVILLLAAVVLAAIQLTTATVISSAFGVVCTFMNAGIYKYVSEYRKSFE